MAIDPSRFHLPNVIDTCAIWHVLSSKMLYQTSLRAGCYYCCTQVVYYEAVVKVRTNPSEEDLRLQQQFEDECENGLFPRYHLDLEDLQEVEILENRKRLSKGELSSIAFAKKTGQAFLTDDQKARKLAASALPQHRVQTTPHLLGWLVFANYFSDGDKDIVIDEHKISGQNLAEYFEKAYLLGLEYRLKATLTQAD
jgi:predicted nucleic acid-binding protein